MGAEIEAREGCYASLLGDCAGPLSREHAVSEAVLDSINQGEGVVVSGTSWIEEGSRTLPPSALGSRVLCKRHNEQLGPIYEVGVTIFAEIRRAIRDAHAACALGVEQTVSGEDFAMWLLKVFCGSIASGQFRAQSPGEPSPQPSVEPEWVEVLFGRKRWPSHWSVAIVVDQASHLYTEGGGVEIAPLNITATDRIGAFEVRIEGVRFLLFLSGRPRNLEGQRLVYLPLRMSFRPASTVGYRDIVLVWPKRAIRETVTFIMSGSSASAPDAV